MTQTATKDGDRAFDGVIAKGSEWWSQATKPLLAGLGKGPIPDQLVDLVDKSFDCASQILEAQRDYAKAVLAMWQHAGDRTEPKTRARTPAS